MTQKKVQASCTFFSRANEVKTCGLAQQLILRMLRDLVLQLRNSHWLDGDSSLDYKELCKTLFTKAEIIQTITKQSHSS